MGAEACTIEAAGVHLSLRRAARIVRWNGRPPRGSGPRSAQLKPIRRQGRDPSWRRAGFIAWRWNRVGAESDPDADTERGAQSIDRPLARCARLRPEKCWV